MVRSICFALQVRPPDVSKELKHLKEGGNLISYIQPAVNTELVDKLKEKQMTVVGALYVNLAPHFCSVLFACQCLCVHTACLQRNMHAAHGASLPSARTQF